MTDTHRRWQEPLAGMERALTTWGSEHPEATLTEIEQAVDQQVRVVRAQMIADLAGSVTPVETCPRCGEQLLRRGSHTRTLLSADEHPLALTRDYASCPGCGAGLFPPG